MISPVLSLQYLQERFELLRLQNDKEFENQHSILGHSRFPSEVKGTVNTDKVRKKSGLARVGIHVAYQDYCKISSFSI